MNKMRPARGFLVVLAVLAGLALFPGAASGKYIQITTTISTAFIPQGTTLGFINYTVANTGDDYAGYSMVSGWTNANGVVISPVFVGDLGPNVSRSVSINMSIPAGVTPGTYGISLINSYRDPNGVQFSAVSSTLYSIGSQVQGDLQIYPASVDIPQDGSGTLTARISDRGDKPETATLYLVLPNEIYSGNSSTLTRTVQLTPKSAARADFQISNGGAIAPSTYPVQLFGEVVTGGLVYTSYGTMTVNIVKSDSTQLYYYAALVLVILVAGYLAYTLIIRKHFSIRLK